MSRALSPALQAHYQSGTTTLARCWKCTRVDGTVFGFTNIDRDITFAGVTYAAATGVTPSAIDGKIDMSVPNLEVAGMLSSSAITENDLLGGLWDNCAVEIFEVNWADLTQGRMILATGIIGQVTAGRSAFTAELRGLMQALQQRVGNVYTRSCTANLGDARCQYAVEAQRVAASVTAVSTRAAFSASSLAQAADWFGAGVITWTSGANAGASMEVSTFIAGALVLAQAMPFNVAVGDAFTIVPGCRKRALLDCQAKFSNLLNFRGFPNTPGNDAVIGFGGITS